MANPRASQSITADRNNKPLLSTRQSNVVDAAAATAAAAALTGAANAGVTASNPSAPTAYSAVTNMTEPVTKAEGETLSAALATLVTETTSYETAISANIVDIALILAQADKSTIDIAAQKVELDKLITDVGLARVAVNSMLDILEAHGLMAA